MKRDLVWFLLLSGVVAGNAYFSNLATQSSLALQHEVRKLRGSMEQQQLKPTSTALTLNSIDASALRAELRQLVDSACAQDSNAHTPHAVNQPEPAAEADVVPQPSPQAIRAFDESNQLVDRGILRRSWDVADADALHDLLAAVDEQTRHQVRLRVVQAVNDGRITPVMTPIRLF